MPTIEYLNYVAIDDHAWDVDDSDLFAYAADADLDTEDYGSFEMPTGKLILRHAEQEGLNWPFSCRTGRCINCAVILKDGEIEMGAQRVLSEEEIRVLDLRLVCIGTPRTETVKLIYNAKHMDRLRSRIR